MRVVVPICFEDIDAPLVAKMFRGAGGKRANVLVNLTNDGWFKANQNAQHLQAAIFRGIENRVPTIRCVNTGISAFIDSSGRELERIPVRTEGTAIRSMQLDSRYTLYTRWGDWFPILCTVLASGLVVRVYVKYRRSTNAKLFSDLFGR